MPHLYRWGIVNELPGASYGKIELNVSIPYFQTHMIWSLRPTKIIIKGAEIKAKECSVMEKKKKKKKKRKEKEKERKEKNNKKIRLASLSAQIT